MCDFLGEKALQLPLSFRFVTLGDQLHVLKAVGQFYGKVHVGDTVVSCL